MQQNIEDNLTQEKPFYFHQEYATNPSAYNEIHKHNAVEIIYIEEGKANIIIDYKLYPIKKGDIIFINSGIAHSILINENDMLKISYMQFLPEIINSYGHDLYHINYFYWLTIAENNDYAIYSVEESAWPAKLIKNISTAYQNDALSFEVTFFSDIILLCVWFFETWYERTEGNLPEITYTDIQIIRNIYEEINNNISAMNLNDICLKSNTSADYVTKYFKKMSGMSFRKYIEKKRISKAKFLLATTKMHITEVAYSIGFSDSSYFSTLFKSKTGLSPIAFRKEHQISNYLKKNKQEQSNIYPYYDKDYIFGIHPNSENLFYNFIYLSSYYDLYTKRKNNLNDFFEIILCDCGTVKITFDDETYILNPGEFVITTPYERHIVESMNFENHILWVQFYPESLNIGDKIFPFNDLIYYLAQTKRRFFSISQDATDILQESFFRIFVDSRAFAPSSEISIRANILKILAWIIEKTYESYTPYDTVASSKASLRFDEILEYVNSHYTEDITLENVAERFSLNTSYLSRKFKETTHMKFKRYINSKRIMKSRLLLATTNYQISEIASMLSFCSRSRFAEKFIQSTHLTPTEFRRVLKERIPIDKNYYELYKREKYNQIRETDE